MMILQSFQVLSLMLESLALSPQPEVTQIGPESFIIIGSRELLLNYSELLKPRLVACRSGRLAFGPGRPGTDGMQPLDPFLPG
eukprot:615473-Hanusia_phi.AAC.1